MGDFPQVQSEGSCTKSDPCWERVGCDGGPAVSNNATGPKTAAWRFFDEAEWVLVEEPGYLARPNRCEVWRKKAGVFVDWRNVGRGVKDRERGLPSTSRSAHDKSPSGEYSLM